MIANKEVKDQDVKFVGETSKGYFCPVCAKLLRDPFQFLCCGNHVCRECTTALQATSNAACPHCKKLVNDVVEDKHHKRKIWNLRVRCHYRNEGCKWEGDLRDLQRHVNSNGPQFTDCACGCGEEVRTRSTCTFALNPLIAYCKKRPISCIYCSLKGTYDKITSSHCFTCADFPVECPNNCHIEQSILAMGVFKQSHLQKHLEQECSQRVVTSSKQSETHFANKQASIFPVTATLTSFSACKAQNVVWFSPPFLTTKEGYKLQLRVYPNGFGSAVGTHVSVFVCIVHGEHDEKLQWPLKAEMVVDILNWRGDEGHHSKKVYFLGDGLCNEVKKSYLSPFGTGHAEFISHATLALNAGSKTAYLSHNSLCFHVRELRKLPVSRTPMLAWDSGLPSECVFEFKVTGLSMYCNTNTPYFSPPYYTSLQGYRICHCVSTQVIKSKEYISVGVQLLKGQHDEKLQWPFRADIMIEALNWNADSKHVVKTIRFSDLTPDAASCRVVADDMASQSWGNQQFLAHLKLHRTDPQYLKEDCLYFRVKKIVTYSVPGLTHLPSWQDLARPSYSLCEFSLTDFTKRKKHDNVHYSTSFRTHPQGNMVLEVYANGFGAGKGNHISIFAYVKKGQGCDSFTKPAKGYLAIDVLNWREDSDHYRQVIDFSGVSDTDIPSTEFNTGELDRPLWGSECYIAHSNLSFHAVKNTQYLHNDCLLFRIQEVSTYSDPLIPKAPAWKGIRAPTATKNTDREFTLTKFSRYVQQDKIFTSRPFYTHQRGYKFCLQIYPNGTGERKSTHVSVYVQLLKGEYDNELQWPFQADFTVEFLNWINNARQHSRTISYTGNTPEVYSRISQGDVVANEWGTASFITHELLPYSHETNTQYLLDDCVYVKVKDSIVYSDRFAQKTPSWQPLSNFVEYTLNHFSWRTRFDSTYYSAPFYAFPGGYKMHLVVYPNGDSTARYTHLSLFCYLLEGEYDDALAWPLDLDVVVELLNWYADRDHHQEVISFGGKASLDSRMRVVDGKEADGWGYSQFIDLQSLLPQGSYASRYVQEDCLRIRIRDVVVHSSLSKKIPYYSWPVLNLPSPKLLEFTVANFSKHRQYNSIFCSEPFYTHKRGYKFRVELYANGHKEGEGSHVSVYFVNLKGEYDDRLRWPVKIRIFFQLVNWKKSKENTNFREQITYSNVRPMNNEGNSWGYSKFISHHSLYNPRLPNIVYLEDNCIRFRVKSITRL